MAVAPSDIRFRRSMTQRSEDLLKQITLFLQTHPTEAASLGLPLPPQTLPVPLAPSEQPAEQPAPQKRHVRSARVYWRRSFYAAVVMGLAFLAFNVTQLMYLEHKSRNAQELVVEEVRQNRGWLGRVVVVQAVIITFNVILTWRGVKVWMVLRRIKLGQLLRRIKHHLVPLRWTLRKLRQVGHVLSWSVAPIRLPLRAIRAAQTSRIALQKAEAAKRAATIGSIFASGFTSKAIVAG